MARADASLTALQRIHEAPILRDGWARALPSTVTGLRSSQACLTAPTKGRPVRSVDVARLEGHEREWNEGEYM